VVEARKRLKNNYRRVKIVKVGEMSQKLLKMAKGSCERSKIAGDDCKWL
jgi:hypothetical protein